MLVALIAGALTLAVLLVAWSITSAVSERAEVRDSLRRLEGYQIQGMRDQEMLQPFQERVMTPVGEALSHFVRRFTPQGYIENTRAKLVHAGNPRLGIDDILVLKLLGVASIVGWILLVWVVLGFRGFLGVLVILGLWLVSFLGPDVWLSRTVNERKHEIAVTLPDVLDLLVISVEAGLGFEQALDRTTASIPGALSEEFSQMLQEIRLGASRADALRSMEERTDVAELRSFILAMLQADTFGVSIARLLRAQADEMRVRRRLRAQEQAQKAPVKMLFPLVFCIFPAVFVVILGPAMIQLSENL